MIIVLLFVWILAGALLGHFAGQAFNKLKPWFAARRKFVCDGCKNTCRLHHGFTRVPIDINFDLEFGSPSAVPVNLKLCRNCVPKNAQTQY